MAMKMRQLLNRRMAVCLVGGFSSGLPLFMFIYLLPAWMQSYALNLHTIAAASLFMLPYSLKFLWAPLLDRYRLTRLGRRRSWILLCLFALTLGFNALGQRPATASAWVSFWGLFCAFFSASMDTAIDALRREILSDEELGLGSALHVNAYKVASLVPGSFALILSDHLPWSEVFSLCSLFLLPAVLMLLWIDEPPARHGRPDSLKEAVQAPLQEFFSRHGRRQALAILAFILLYKLGDGMATTLATPFYLQLGYSRTLIGLVAKQAGLLASIAGGLLGGLWMLRLGITRALYGFGVAQAASILGFVLLSLYPGGVSTLALVIAAEAFGVGLGTTALVAYLAQQTDPRHTATQFALLTSLAALPRSLFNASSGWCVEHWGWTLYFIFCLGLSLPAFLLLRYVAPWPRVGSS